MNFNIIFRHWISVPMTFAIIKQVPVVNPKSIPGVLNFKTEK